MMLATATQLQQVQEMIWVIWSYDGSSVKTIIDKELFLFIYYIIIEQNTNLKQACKQGET